VSLRSRLPAGSRFASLTLRQRLPDRHGQTVTSASRPSVPARRGR